jgi:hypothetical protein
MTVKEHFPGVRYGGLWRRLRRMLPVRKLGAVRTVILTRHYVFKIPGRWRWSDRRWWWDFVLRGLLSNMQERKFSCEGWPEPCPVCFSFPGGFLIVMPRATPLSEAQWQQFNYRAFVTRGEGYVESNFDARSGDWRQGHLGQPLHCLVLGNAEPDAGIIPAEYKRDSFGALNGRIVAVDYG